MDLENRILQYLKDNPNGCLAQGIGLHLHRNPMDVNAALGRLRTARRVRRQSQNYWFLTGSKD